MQRHWNDKGATLEQQLNANLGDARHWKNLRRLHEQEIGRKKTQLPQLDKFADMLEEIPQGEDEDPVRPALLTEQVLTSGELEAAMRRMKKTEHLTKSD